MKIKALSLWQPWASLIAIGAKKIETRGWSTKYRGPLVICSAKRPASRYDVDHETAVAIDQALRNHDMKYTPFESGPYGCALCQVILFVQKCL